MSRRLIGQRGCYLTGSDCGSLEAWVIFWALIQGIKQLISVYPHTVVDKQKLWVHGTQRLQHKGLYIMYITTSLSHFGFTVHT
jgi:hypothetical protein